MKIADFGLAVDLAQDYYGRRDGHEDMGSPLRLALKWLPIEVLRNRRYVHTSIDQWSVGVVMWELTTVIKTKFYKKKALTKENIYKRKPFKITQNIIKITKAFKIAF